MRMTLMIAVLASMVAAGIASAQLNDGSDVWYKFNAEAGTKYTLTVTPTTAGFDATMALFSQAQVDDLANVAAPLVHEMAGRQELPGDLSGENYIRVAGLKTAAGYSEGAFDILITEPAAPPEGEVEGEGEVAPCVLAPTIQVPAKLEVACDDFAAAQDEIKAAFEGVAIGGEPCGNAAAILEGVRVKQIEYTSLKKKAETEILDLPAIAENIKEFGEYDYTIAKTQKLFHYNLLFKPGEYKITYELTSPVATTAVQEISVAKNCGGCLGCLSCDSCQGCRNRRVPDYAEQLKRMVGDWLLIGLSVMVMLSLSAMRKPM